MSNVTYDENGIPSDRNDPNAVPWTKRPIEFYRYTFPKDGSVFAPIAPEGTLLMKSTVEDAARLEDFLFRSKSRIGNET